MVSRHRTVAVFGALWLTLSSASPLHARTHEVGPGESLWGLAKQYGVSVEALKSENSLTTDTIRTGQKLSIPVVSSEPEPSVAPSEPALGAPNAESQHNTHASPSSLNETAPRWVLEKPPASAQGEKTNAARGGIFPCAAPDSGFGNYAKWIQVAPMAHLLAPEKLVLSPENSFDVVFHFHGREPLRKEWVQAMDQVVLVAIDVGIDSSSYSEAFSDPRTFRQVVLAVEQAVARRAGRSRATVREVGLTAWSAGYGAIEKLLDQPYAQEVVDSVVLLDGLHAGYTESSLDHARLGPFARFAVQASRGEKLMFVSHSSIPTPGFASTTETSQYLIWKVGGQPKAVQPNGSDPWGLERLSMFSQGSFHVRGFRGSGAADHCAHLGLVKDVLRVHLRPRWERAPAQRAEPKAKAPEALALEVPRHLGANPP